MNAPQPEYDDMLCDELTEIVTDAMGEDAGVRDPSATVNEIIKAFRQRGYFRPASPSAVVR